MILVLLFALLIIAVIFKNKKSYNQDKYRIDAFAMNQIKVNKSLDHAKNNIMEFKYYSSNNNKINTCYIIPETIIYGRIEGIKYEDCRVTFNMDPWLSGLELESLYYLQDVTNINGIAPEVKDKFSDEEFILAYLDSIVDKYSPYSKEGLGRCAAYVKSLLLGDYKRSKYEYVNEILRKHMDEFIDKKGMDLLKVTYCKARDLRIYDSLIFKYLTDYFGIQEWMDEEMVNLLSAN